jgi:hypothetical protein
MEKSYGIELAQKNQRRVYVNAEVSFPFNKNGQFADYLHVNT